MKILNFGSLNIDLVYTVDHFVRPGETISSLRFERFCGGKGSNQSIALARAGADVYHAGLIGQDGAFLKENLADCGVHTEFIRTVEAPSGNALIQVDNTGQNSIVLYAGANRQFSKSYIDEVLSHFSQGDMVLLQNEVNNTDYMVESAYKKGLTIALNPSPMDDLIYGMDLSKITYFILNEIEGRDLTGTEIPREITRRLKKKYPLCRVVLTLGKEGVLYYDGIQEIHHGIFDVPVVDTTAAGDTFTGYFLAMIMAGESVPEALMLASKASSLAVSVKGAGNSIPSFAQVQQAKF